MAAIAYTKGTLIERIKLHVSGSFTGADFKTSDEEILLYIDQALAANMIGQVFALAKVEGNLCMPEAYITTYILPAVVQDNVTKEWYSTLPQTPVSLPLGYSVMDAYFADAVNGKGENIFWVKSKRTGYRNNMPKPFGVSGKIEGSKIILEASNGQSLSSKILYIQMASTRTVNLSDKMTVPDDAIEAIFMNVVSKLKDRMSIPSDIILDDVSAGNKTS